MHPVHQKSEEGFRKKSLNNLQLLLPLSSCHAFCLRCVSFVNIRGQFPKMWPTWDDFSSSSALRLDVLGAWGWQISGNSRVYIELNQKSFHNHWILEIDYSRKPLFSRFPPPKKKGGPFPLPNNCWTLEHQWFQLFCDTLATKVQSHSSPNDWWTAYSALLRALVLPKFAEKKSTIIIPTTRLLRLVVHILAASFCLHSKGSSSCPLCWMWGWVSQCMMRTTARWSSPGTVASKDWVKVFCAIHGAKWAPE